MNEKQEWTSYKGYVLTKPEDVKGFNKLSEECKKIFAAFLKNFYKDWECPEEYVPEKVAFKKDKASGAYLRVEFTNEWFHVTGPNSWY